MADLDFDADTVQGAMNYFVQRDLQLEESGWRLRLLMAVDEGYPWGVLARFETDEGEQRFAVYVLFGNRGAGFLTEFLMSNPDMKFITVDDCNVAGFYEKLGRDCLVISGGGL